MIRRFLRWLRQHFCAHRWVSVYRTVSRPRRDLTEIKAGPAFVHVAERALVGATWFHERCERCQRERDVYVLGVPEEENET